MSDRRAGAAEGRTKKGGKGFHSEQIGAAVEPPFTSASLPRATVMPNAARDDTLVFRVLYVIAFRNSIENLSMRRGNKPEKINFYIPVYGAK